MTQPQASASTYTIGKRGKGKKRRGRLGGDKNKFIALRPGPVSAGGREEGGKGEWVHSTVTNNGRGGEEEGK